MDYTVWIKDEFAEGWVPHDCGDQTAAKRKVLDAAKLGREVRMTVEVPFEVQLKVGEPGAEVRRKGKKPEPPAEETTEEELKNEADQNPAE